MLTILTAVYVDNQNTLKFVEHIKGGKDALRFFYW